MHFMKNVFVFPFTANQLPLLRYQSLNKDINIVPVLPPCYQLPDCNLAILDHGAPVSYTTADYKCASKDDSFCFSHGDHHYGSIEFGTKFLKELHNTGSRIEADLSPWELEQVQSYESGVYDRIKSTNWGSDVIQQSPRYRDELNDIRASVYAVGSLMADNNKAEVCLALTQHLRNTGKKAVCVLSEYVYHYLGVNTFNYYDVFSDTPDNMLLRINHYFYELQQATNCDCIVCDIPGSLFKYSKKVVNSAGIYAFILSQAISINKLICCAPLSYSTMEYYQLIADQIHSKFDVGEVYFHMSNYMFMSNAIPVSGSLPGCYVPASTYESVLAEVNKSGAFLYDFRKEDQLAVSGLN